MAKTCPQRAHASCFNALLDLQDEFNAVAKEAESTSDKLKQATVQRRPPQGSIFDTFASDAQKLEAAKKIVNDTFASIGRAVPDSAASFLELSQALVPTDKASQDLINTLAKVSNAFAYVEKSVADTAAGITAAASAAAASRRSVMDSYDPASAVTRAQADINAAFARIRRHRANGSRRTGGCRAASIPTRPSAANKWRHCKR